jgi:hypothetical protein
VAGREGLGCVPLQPPPASATNKATLNAKAMRQTIVGGDLRDPVRGHSGTVSRLHRLEA